MFLKRIELIGFKSFAKKTILEFPQPSDSEGVLGGITAVVGPNGSGKSNVADAIRWVMGEQSPKSLRGKKSHDVIFAGSHGKAQLGFAQVTLIFDNTDGRLPIAFGEVAIARKVHRDGTGEYRINDSKARLIDVVDLLAKAGISTESHCVINQGMSDATLNATALDRRSIIEEAAGVKPYQIKRDRSIRKLRTTRENLDRTKELIIEIEPRLKLLKRQKQRAEQREEVIRELKFVQKNYYAYRWGSLLEEKKQSQLVLDAIGIEVEKVEKKMKQLAQDREKKTSQLENTNEQQSLESELSKARHALSVLDREQAVVEGRLQIEQEKAKAQKLVEIIPVDIPFVQSQIKDVQSIYNAFLDRIQNAKTINELSSIQEEAQLLAKKLSALYEDCGKTTVERNRAEEVISAERKAFEEKITSLDAEVAHIHEKIQSQEAGIKKLEEKIQTSSQSRKELNESFFAIEREVHIQQRELDILRTKESDARVSLARFEVREEDLLKEIFIETQEDPQKFETITDDNFRPNEAESVISRLKSKLAMIGGIDPSVAQEYHETQERYDFLTQETQDLENAIISLEEVIVEMDKRIQTEFTSAFGEINKQFNHFFQLMFEGGNAELKKIKIEKKLQTSQQDGFDSEDQDEDENENDVKEETIIETGVEILVNPPKKKIHNLSMMSGGERSLVSLALLFAIIAYNPPPFAVLDEVEAALDEANSRKFSLLIRELSSKTQFIIITHNRETMRSASILYGVTMANDGISKLLSVKLDEAEKKEMTE